jgi:hypothetical protein
MDHVWKIGAGISQPDYKLDDRSLIPGTVKWFSSNLCVHTGSEARPASCTMVTGGPSPEVKCGRGVTLTTHRHLVPRSWMSSNYTSSPPYAFIDVLWDGFTFRNFCEHLHVRRQSRKHKYRKTNSDHRWWSIIRRVSDDDDDDHHHRHFLVHDHDRM